MALIRVDLPEPFGPSSATCSPRRICRLRLRLTTLSPRTRVTPAKSMRREGATDFLTTDEHGLTRIKSRGTGKPPMDGKGRQSGQAGMRLKTSAVVPLG